MARNLGWVAAFALLMLAGCDGFAKMGVGGSCRQDRECTTGLDCVNRVCAARAQKGAPDSSDKPIKSEIPVPMLEPIDAGAAGADGG